VQQSRFARAACLLLASAVLSACGGGTDSAVESQSGGSAPSSQSTDPAAQPTVAPVSTEAGELRFVVRLASAGVSGASADSPAQRIAKMQANLASKPDAPRFTALRTLSSGAVVVVAPKAVTADSARQMAARLAVDPQVLSVEPDVRVSSVQTTPPEVAVNDPHLGTQWALRAPSAAFGGGNFRAAWNSARGEGVTVAVLDTGSLAHPDLAANLVPGYDFVSDPTMAGDGGGRDADATDVGDFCGANASSWHGVAVASQIAAVANNGSGMAGAAPAAKVMPIRVLGRCGGWLSDTADALAWLAGRTVPGAVANTRKVHVANLSLGGNAACFQYMQEAVTSAVNAGITVVAAAGNNGINGISAPANCVGALAIGAHNASGDLANYSNHGQALALTAPGGGACRSGVGINCDSTPTLALGIVGATTFQGYGDVRYFAGTSAAAPHAAAAAALLYTLRPEITPAQVRSALVTSARPHAANGFCAMNKGLCGAGLLDAAAALRQLGGTPLVQIDFGAGITRGTQGATQQGLVARGAQATLTASAASLLNATFQWRQTAGTPVTPVAGAASNASYSFIAPSVSGPLSFEVTAVAGGQEARNTVTVLVNNPPSLPATLTAARVRTAYSNPLPVRDADGDALTYVLLSGPAGLTVAPGGVLSWPQPSGTSAPLTLRVTDVFGQAATQTYTLAVTNSAPVITLAPTVRVAAATALSVPVAATDPEGSAVSLALSGAPAGMALSNGAIRWPSPIVGRYTVAVTATDADGGRAQAAIIIEVVAANRAPTVQNTTYTGMTNAPVTGSVAAIDPDGDRLSYAIVGSAPRGFTLDAATGRFAWLAPLAGSTQVTVAVRDPAGASTRAVLTFNIARENRPPLVASMTIVVPTGTRVSQQVPAIDPDGDALTFTLTGAPAGVSISSTGLLQWDRVGTGSYRSSVVVRDARGLTGAGSISIVAR
jgi:serine protease